MNQVVKASIPVFISYAPQDEELLFDLEKHLRPLQKKGVITTWHRAKVSAGNDLIQLRDKHLAAAKVVLLLMSADFINTEGCYEIELLHALANHRSGQALVIPILLRPTNVQQTPVAHLQCLPRNGVPITKWRNRDEAFQSLVSEIQVAIADLYSTHQQQPSEKERRLYTMVSDSSGFMQDRLNNFVGRQQELAELRQHIAALQQTGGYLTVTGQAGQGKSSVIAKLIEEECQKQNGPERVAFHFIPLTPGQDHQIILLRNLMARLILKHNLSDLPLISENRAVLSMGFLKVLKEIADQGRHEIIFIDGLDQLEAEHTGFRDLSFLPQGPGYPPNGIVFVLGTRPNDTLRPLELLKPHIQYQLPNLSRADFDQVLYHRGVILERTLADSFYETLHKNALYLDLVAKELAARGPITSLEKERIIRQIAENPENLFSLALNRLKQQRLWQEVIKPILGLLLVTNEPLSRLQIKQLVNLGTTPEIDGEQLNASLEYLGGLIVTDGHYRYTLFHLKFRDYLRQDLERPHKSYLFDAEDERYWHRRFIAWCEQGGLARIWDDIKAEDSEWERYYYARWHYITHLYQGKEWGRLFEVLDEGAYGRAKTQYDSSTRSYALDLDLGRNAAASGQWSQEEAIQHLPHLWRYTLLHCSLASRADMYPVNAFRLMLLLRQERKVLGLFELITNQKQKSEVCMLIANFLSAKSGREQDADKFILQAEQICMSITSERNRTEASVALANSLVQERRWQEAERICSSIPDKRNRAKALIALASSLAQEQQQQEAKRIWQEAERIGESISEKWSREEVLTTLASSLAQGQDWQEAKRICGSISDKGGQAKALITLASSLAQEQHWQEAERIWQEAEHISGSVSSKDSRAEVLVALASSLARGQQWQEAERICESISEQWNRAPALIALASSLAQGQQWQEAERICSSISDKERRTEALVALANSLVQERRWQEAERICSSIPDKRNRAKALIALASSLAQEQHWQEAKRIWQEAERIGESISGGRSRIETLIALANSLAHEHRWQEAERIWQEAERICGSISNKENHVEALITLASSLAQEQHWQEAERIWQEAEHISGSVSSKDSRAEVLVALASSLARGQQWQEAERICGSISEQWNRAPALIALASSLAQGQQWQEAERICTSIPNEWIRAEALVTLANSLAHEQCWQEAERICSSISSKRNRAEALVALASALAHEQRWQEAERICSSISDKECQAKALTARASSLAHEQRWQEAERIWQEAERICSSISSEWSRAPALTALASSLAQERQWQEAERICSSISDKRHRAEALVALASSLAHEQRWQEAERICSSISDKRHRAEALVALASSLAHEQRWQEAERIWQEAERICSSISSKRNRAEALIALAGSRAQEQQRQEAERIWQEAERICSSISDKGTRVHVLRNLTNCLARHHEYGRLLSLVYYWWRQDVSRADVTKLLPLAFDLIELHPSFDLAFSEAFTWVDNFLRG